MQRREALRNTAFLAGCGLSIGTMTSIITGCESGAKTTGATTYLAPDKYELLSQICETIIPTTDTPGAIEAGVPAYIDESISAMMTDEELTGMKAGLDQIEAKAKELHGKSFVKLGTDEREATLLAIAAMEGDQNIFNMLQGITKQVYFTSEVGATQALKFDPIPGKYVGCVPLADVGKAWAL